MKKITLLNYLYCVILFFAFIPAMNAQLENANWYFGNQTGLNFNDGTLPPTILTDNMMSATGGTATVSDDTGNLLFYTNGIDVWNKTHTIMPNGSGLFGSTTVSQSVVVVPKPDDANKYYVFTNQGQDLGSAGLSYSVVDMATNEGSGDVDPLTKNINLLPNSSEKLTAILNPIDNTYWLVSFAPSTDPANSDTFYAYRIDNTGINLMSQSTFSFQYPANPDNTSGQMKISPDGLNIALTHNTKKIETITVLDSRGNIISQDTGITGAEGLYRFDFNSTTGAVTLFRNFFFIPLDVLNYHGLEFSPDSNLLYVSTTETYEYLDTVGTPIGRLYQVDYRHDAQQIQTTKIFEGPNPIYGIQAGINGKLYAVNSTGNLSTINTPIIPGFGANYVHEDINLGGLATKELPQTVPEVFVSATLPKNYLPKKPVLQGNPFKDEMKFKFKFIQTYTIEFYNSMGILVKNVVYDDMTNRKVYKINTVDLLSDTYYLIIRDEHSQIWYETTLKIE